MCTVRVVPRPSDPVIIEINTRILPSYIFRLSTSTFAFRFGRLPKYPAVMSSSSREEEKPHKELAPEIEYEDGNSETTYEPIGLIDPSEVETLTRIATQQSRRQSTSGPTHRLASLAEQDPTLNPQSGKFDLRKWIIAAMRDVGRERGQRMGVVFKDLNIYGSGSELQFQDTVSSMLTAPLRIGEAFHKSPKKRILKNFNGILKSGELLLVLGRPGAGCSTMLKSIMGELHGLEMGEGSVINYNGKKLSTDFTPKTGY